MLSLLKEVQLLDYLAILLKLLFGFVGLLITLRLLGKKELSQVTPFDIIYSVVFGGILEESLYDRKITLLQMLFAIFCWGAIIYIVDLLTTKSQRVRTFLKGTPAYLIEDGVINIKEMKRNKIEMEQLRSLLRIQNIFSLKEVRYLILEPGGQVSVLKYDQYETPTKSELAITPDASSINYLLINNGVVLKKELAKLNKSEQWLQQLLKEKGYENEKNIIYAEWSATDGIYIKSIM